MTTLAEVSWRERAACRGMNPDLFYPERGEDSRQAKAVCASCPVREACAAESVDEHYGIWGGHSERERRRRRAGRPIGPKPRPIAHGEWAGYLAHIRRGIPVCAECRVAARLFRGADFRARQVGTGSPHADAARVAS